MSTEAMKQALEAIQDLRGYRPDIDKAIEALRAALPQQPDNTACRSVQKRLAAQQDAAQAQKSTDPQDTYVNGLAQANNEQD